MGFVIGTAGHIDHGKTALVKALTGQDTDRLPDEKARGISIDLGFAQYELPGQTSVGIIDVPGHQKFIRNMVAGSHGLDLVLMVVAANDGVMPQTEEHFDILCSLGVRQAVIVVTKIDMVDDARLAEVHEEIDILIDGSPFEGSDILPVSSPTGMGIEALKGRIAEILGAARTRGAEGWFRMPVDRVFSVHGRGVVITGTLLSGAVSAGDEIALVPGAHLCRVRGLQRHGVQTGTGRSGDRLAINLTGAERKGIRRGDVACDPAIARVSDRFDTLLSLAGHAANDLAHGQRVRLHLGAAERLGVLLLLDKKNGIERGGTELVQIRVTEPLQVMAGDHFVIRDEQAEHTIGGGQILDPVGVRPNRGDPVRQARLQALAQSNPLRAAELLIDGAASLGMPADDLLFRLNMPRDALINGINANPALIRLKAGAKTWIASAGNCSALVKNVCATLADYHAKQPASPGLSLEELHDLIVPAAERQLFRAVLGRAKEQGLLRRHDAALSLPSHRTGLTTAQQAAAEEVLDRLKANPFSPPSLDLKNKEQAVAASHLEREGRIVRVSKDIFFTGAAFDHVQRSLEDHLSKHGEISAAQLRDLLGTSRKYALALLEHFDRIGRTVRIGDVRKTGRPRAAARG